MIYEFKLVYGNQPSLLISPLVLCAKLRLWGLQGTCQCVLEQIPLIKLQHCTSEIVRLTLKTLSWTILGFKFILRVTARFTEVTDCCYFYVFVFLCVIEGKSCLLRIVLSWIFLVSETAQSLKHLLGNRYNKD